MAALPLTHAGQYGIQGIDDTDEVDLDLCGEVFGAEPFGRCFDTDAGAGYEQIGRPHLFFQACHRRAHRRQIGDIGNSAGNAFALEIAGEPIKPLALAIQGSDTRSLSGESKGELPSNTASRSCYQGNAITERFHAASVYGT